MSIFTRGIVGRFGKTPIRRRLTDALQRFHRLRFLDFLAAFLASAARVVIPEIEHRLAEMLDDIRAIEVNVFHQCAAIFTVENDVFLFSRWAAPLDYHTDCVRRSLRRMRNIWWNEECLAFSDDVIHDAIAFASAHLNVALELVEVLLRIHKMKNVPGFGPLIDHPKKIASVVQIPIAHRRLKFVGVLVDPFFQVNRRLHSRHAQERIWHARTVKPSASSPARCPRDDDYLLPVRAGATSASRYPGRPY